MTMAEETNPNLLGLGTNYAATNLWYAYLPLENILGKKYSNLDLHIKRFNIPQLEMGSMETPYKGYKKQMPTKVLNSEAKELTLTYIIDEKWHNYKSLFAWISGINGTLNPIVNEEIKGISPSQYIPLRIYLLDNYKQKVIQFYFENCWIKYFGEVQLDVANSNEIEHSFTFCYDRYYIEDV